MVHKCISNNTRNQQCMEIHKTFHKQQLTAQKLNLSSVCPMHSYWYSTSASLNTLFITEIPLSAVFTHLMNFLNILHTMVQNSKGSKFVLVDWLYMEWQRTWSMPGGVVKVMSLMSRGCINYMTSPLINWNFKLKAKASSAHLWCAA